MFVAVLRVLLRVLVLSALIPLFLFLSVLFPKLQGLFVVFWFLALVFDLRSTYSFYVEDPEKFGDRERNKMLVLLVENVGFRKTSVVFPLLVELPILTLFAFILLPVAWSYFFTNTMFDPSACLATSFAIGGVGHAQAMLQNFTVAKGKKATHDA